MTEEEAFAVVVSRSVPGCPFGLSAKEPDLEMPGKVVWGVKRGWSGVAGRP